MKNLDWRCLNHVDIELTDTKTQNKNSNLFCRDVYSVFAENKGILVIFGLGEVICVKLKLSSDENKVMTLSDIGRIKGINGSSLVYDNLNTFLLATDGNLFKFRTFKKITELSGSNMKFLHFTGQSYIVVEQQQMSLKVKLFDSFGETFVERKCEFDLSFVDDPVTNGGDRDNEKVCAIMIENITKERELRFFNELLACQFDHENITSILLVSVDERLTWIKFSGNFRVDPIDDYSVELLTCTKSKIIGLHYFKNVLLLIDEQSMLTIFYRCQATQLIRKKEVVVGGKILCFRFYGWQFLFSTSEKLTIIDLREPWSPSEKFAHIKNINCFTVVDSLKFVLAICRNNFVYHIPLIQQQRCQNMTNGNGTCFVDISDSDYESIPEVARFFEIEERRFIDLENRIKTSQRHKQLLERLELESSGDFIAGEATIRFHQNMPNSFGDDVRLCQARGQALKACILEVEIQFHPIFVSSNLTVTFAHENAASTTSIRRIKIENAKTREKLCLPIDGQLDKMKCDISLKVSLNSEFSRCPPLSYRINVTAIIRPNDRDLQLEDDLVRCKEIVKRLKT